MQFPIPFLDVLTIPIGAGPGEPRIVINGVDGRIEIYDSMGNLTGVLSATTGYQVNEPGDENGIRVRLFTDPTEGPFIELDANDVDQEQVGYIQEYSTSSGVTGKLTMELSSGWFTGGITGPRLILESKSRDGTLSPDLILAGAGEATAQSLPRGIIAQFVETTNDGPHTADTVSDMQLPNIQVVDGRTYKLEVIVSVAVSAAAGRWDGIFRADGSSIGRAFSTLNVSSTSDPALNMAHSPAYYTATATGLVDFDLFLDEVVAGSDITLGANANVPRWLTLIDMGGPVL